MNTLRALFMTALIATALVACDKKEEPKEDETENTEKEKEKEKEKENAGVYIGLLSVDQNNGSFFELDNVQTIIEQTADDTVTITMKDVKFSPGMPISLAEMIIAGVLLSETAEGVSLSGDGIVPIAMGGPFVKYTITNLRGTIIGNTLKFSMKCGEFPLSYLGTK